MSKYNNYLDMLMQNYPLMTGSSEEAKEYRQLTIKPARITKKTKKPKKSKIMKGGNIDTTESEFDTNTDTNSESGTITQGDVPYGGFPPIFLCKTSVEQKDTDKKEREYIKKTTAVSIQDIMKKRRDVVPFLNI